MIEKDEINSTNHLASTPLRTRLFRGTGAQAFGQVVQIVIRLAEVPLLLSFWGTQLYGEWLILSAIPAYLSISDGGFASAACRDMAMKSGGGDSQGVLAVFQSTWVLLLAVSVSVGLLVFGFVQVAPFEKWLGFTAITGDQARFVLLLLVAHVVVGFQGGLLNGSFWVSGHYPTGMLLVATTQLLEFLGFGLAVVLGGGPVQAAAGYFGGRVLGTSFMWIGQRRVISWLRFGFSQASFNELKRLAIPAFASLAFPFGNALNIQGLRLIVGLTLGPTAVAVFVPLRTLSNLIIQPVAAIHRIVEPELALAFGAHNFPLFQRIFTRSSQFSLWGCLGTGLLTGVSTHWIFPIWTSGKLSMNWMVYIILLIGVVVRCIWGAAIVAIYATNRHASVAAFYFSIYGVFAFCLGYLGAKNFGLDGAVLALLLTEAVMAFIIIRASLRLSCMELGKWTRILLHPPIEIISRVTIAFLKRGKAFTQ